MILPSEGEHAGPPFGSVRRFSFVGHAGAALFAVGTLGAALVVSFRKLADFDLPGHLAVGRLVMAHRGLLRVDELSYTHRPVTSVEYVSDLTLYGIVHAFGPRGLQLLGGAMTLALGALLLRGAGRNQPFGFLIVALTLAAIHPWLLVRPATASFVLIALVMSAPRARRGSAKPGRHLAWIVPVFFVWANVHGFVVLGLLLLLLETLYALVCRVARGRLGGLAPPADGRAAASLALVAGLALLASTLNQAGAELLLGPFRAARDFGHITEWATTTPEFLVQQAPLVAVLGLLASLSLAFGGDTAGAGGRTTPTLHDVGVVILALALGRSAVRMLPVAVILVAPVVIRRLGSRLTDPRKLAPLFGLSTWLAGPWVFMTSVTAFGVGFDPDHFSEGAVEFVRASRPAGHVYNSLALGGWMDWRLFPLYETFVDHRQGWVHAPELLASYYASEADPGPFRDLAQAFDFQWAFLFAAEGSTLGGPVAHSPSWAMVYWDDSAAIYVRTEGPNARLARSGYHLLRHLTSPGDVLVSSVKRDQQARTLAHDGQLALAQAPNSPRAAFLAGCAAIALRDRAALDSAVANVRRVAPTSAGAELLERGWQEAEARASTELP